MLALKYYKIDTNGIDDGNLLTCASVHSGEEAYAARRTCNHAEGGQAGLWRMFRTKFAQSSVRFGCRFERRDRTRLDCANQNFFEISSGMWWNRKPSLELCAKACNMSGIMACSQSEVAGCMKKYPYIVYVDP